MNRIILLLVTILCLQPSYARKAAKIDWNADLDFLAKELSEKHYNFFSVRDKEALYTGIEALKAEAKKLTDFQVALKTQQLIATFGDSHTILNFWQFLNPDQVIPLELLWTSDGLHVVRTTAKYRELLGRRVEAIDRIPVMTIVDSLATIITADNRALVKSLTRELFPCLQILANFGFTNTDQAELTLDDNTHYRLKPAGRNPYIVAFKPDSLYFAAANSQIYFTDRYFPDEKSTTCSIIVAEAGRLN